jgi:small subunit ribosomal protein S2
MGGIPDALFVVDVGHEKIAVREANRLGIPVIGIVDSNNDPDGITYIIPGNDDSTRAIRFFAGCVADVILEARASTLEGSEAADEFVEIDVESSEKEPPIEEKGDESQDESEKK